MAESLYYAAPEKIRRFTIDLFVRGGMRAEDAACVADHLIAAQIRVDEMISHAGRVLRPHTAAHK